MTPYQNYIYKSRYARYIHEEDRREDWPETVSRYVTFLKEKNPDAKIPWNKLEQAILNFEIMPSMRALMTAGPALERDNVAGYNCAYTAIDNQRAFDEILYILMCGTGVGFSVERQYIARLPEVAEEFHGTDTEIIVRDSKIGWATGLRQLVSLLYQGQVPKWNLEKLRPAGAVLRTFGGRSSGPEPLNILFTFCVNTFRGAAGRRLNSLEVHDIVCKIAEVVVCGGVRRSALLSLSNLSDPRMRDAKQGEWLFTEPQRRLANNSVCYTERPDMGIFMQEWASLYKSKAGERGIFNRAASQRMCPDRRDNSFEFGTNPCSEIVLRNKQFCNLTEVVVRSADTYETLETKVELATILGTLQATLTDFRYLSKQWKTNTEEERLLGVSLTGIMDHSGLAGKDKARLPLKLEELKEHAIKTNKLYSKRLGIPHAAAITCVKPSGTVSQLVDSSSGIHPRYAKHYIRRVRGDVKDPVSIALQKAGVPCEPSVNNPSELVFSFPMASPVDSITVSDCSAIQQLEHWKTYAVYWCEHKPSVSIYVEEDEWLDVGAWVYKNWNIMNGVSFFPHDNHMYQQAPYEEITYEQLVRLDSVLPDISNLTIIEAGTDTTTASQELACAGGACDL